MIELMDYIANGIESFFKQAFRGILTIFIVCTAQAWVLPYWLIRKYL